MTTTITMSGETLAAILGCDPDGNADETYRITVQGERVTCDHVRDGGALHTDVGPEWTPTRQMLVDAGEIDG